MTSPLLKLFAELVQNRSQRLQFDSTSPNGVLLFREASKVLCSYGITFFFFGGGGGYDRAKLIAVSFLHLGGRILSVEVPKEQIYAAKFKGISVCFSLLKVNNNLFCLSKETFFF